MIIAKTIVAVIDVLIAILIFGVSFKELDAKYALTGSAMALAYIASAIFLYV